MTQTIGVRAFRDELADCLNRAKYSGQRVRIMRHGVEVAGLVSPEDLKQLERTASTTSEAPRRPR